MDVAHAQLVALSGNLVALIEKQFAEFHPPFPPEFAAGVVVATMAQAGAERVIAQSEDSAVQERIGCVALGAAPSLQRFGLIDEAISQYQVDFQTELAKLRSGASQ